MPRASGCLWSFSASQFGVPGDMQKKMRSRRLKRVQLGRAGPRCIETGYAVLPFGLRFCQGQSVPISREKEGASDVLRVEKKKP